MKKNITETKGGLHYDNSRIDTPKGTYKYALNAINETDTGDQGLLSNEESNQEITGLPIGYIPLGKVYIGKNRTAVWLVNEDETLSEIGIFDKIGGYTTYVNGDLGFKLTHQIDATYRLRRGCESTVYWVDGKNNKPMYYVFEKPESFKTLGDWDKNKFELQRGFSSIPKFQDVLVKNSGGQLPPGSYNVAIQYLDVNLNPTEWITTSEIIKIYNDDTTESFLDIRGSINVETGTDKEDFRNFPVTDKSIRLEFTDFDESFLFYRLAFIEATSGTGQVTNIRFTENLPIQNNIFIYTGTNYATEGSIEEIVAFNNIISSAGSIEQADNMLLLGNTQGKQIDYCQLQKYASRIKADMTTKKVLNNQMIDLGNPKSPTATFEAVGYMPGEIYSFGIVYVFKDGTQSPVYHIPGKSNNILDGSNNNISENYVFSPGTGVYPMTIDNESINRRYNDNNSCSNADYWGTDSIGETLKLKKVRHHRFPLRSKFNMDLVTLENTVGSTSEYYQVKLNATGNMITPCTQSDIDTGECAVLLETPPFQVRVTYEVDGVQDTMVVNINPNDFAGAHPTAPLDVTEVSNFIVSSNITIISIEESQDDGSVYAVGVDSGNGTAQHGTLSYTVSVQLAEFTAETRIYSSEIFGIKFSGIDLPSVEDTGGEEVVGYYIVRNERTENEKTILDSAVLTPSVINDKYISHGLLFPEFTAPKISKKVLGVIHPEHKFNNIKYPEFTEVIQEGQFIASDRKKSKSRYLDVVDGTSYDTSVHKSGGPHNDKDGWSIKVITRDNIVDYQSTHGQFDFIQDDVEDMFYLDALQSKEIEDNANTVYNVSGDNKVGMIHLKEEFTGDITNKLPYVYFKRPLADSYSTFRTLPYYKTSINMHDINEDTVVEFNGDTYISPVRYLNTMWWDNRLPERPGKTSVWNYILGSLLVIIGSILLIFGGSGALVIGAGIAVIGGGALFVSSGIKKDTLVRAYYDEYDKGLRETTLDDWVSDEYLYKNTTATTPMDDEIQWLTDCVTDLWFESQVNTSLRYGMTTQPSFLDGPGKVESGNEVPERVKEYFGVYQTWDESLYPFTKLDRYVMDKLTIFNPERGDSREYIGHPLGEYYAINPDFTRLNKQKIFNHLPLEYDCCSDCQEDFPHRIHYSQQSFQEELTDNFRVFLPNDYVDIEGETGKITDLFRIKNNIYIHTEEGLWHQPQNYQERITGDIVSFLGTGGYFNIPARKILDDNKASGGTRHREATLKTKHGVFFVSENEKKIYNFDGNQLKPISDIGMTSWFDNNIRIQLLEEYFEANGKEYPYDNNPSNSFGVGFISTYDTQNERVVFTKKDMILDDAITASEDFEICAKNGDITLFEDYQQTLDTYTGNGFTFEGIEDCKLKFKKIGFNTVIESGETKEVVTIPPDAVVVPFFDTSSMNAATITNLSNTIDAWFPVFKASINDGVNDLTLQNPGTWNQWGSERWVKEPAQLVIDNLGTGLSVLLLVFVDETNPNYHGSSLSTPMSAPTATYIADVDDFINTLHPQFTSFQAINYPIVQNTGNNREYLQHTIAAIEGTNMTVLEVDSLNVNSIFSGPEWDTLKLNLQSNPYVGQPILKDYGWLYREDRVDGIDNNGTVECPVDGVSVITPCQFTSDIEDVLTESTTEIITPVDIEIQEPYDIIEYVEGTVVQYFTKANNSWTISHSLKNNTWTSWHSYLPDFYYYIADRFYSWKHKITGMLFNNPVWKHNRKAHYQNFYNQREPFTIEYTALSEPLKTKVWDDLTLHTEAKKFNATMQEYADVRDVTFNRGIFYNTRQCSGLLDMLVKDANIDKADYMSQQIVNVDPGTIVIDRNERDWSINDIRDIRVTYDQPIFNSSINARQVGYYTDKVLNGSALDENKDWTQLESFRDKYLVVRLIFDTFDDVKLIMNYSIENETDSQR